MINKAQDSNLELGTQVTVQNSDGDDILTGDLVMEYLQEFVVYDEATHEEKIYNKPYFTMRKASVAKEVSAIAELKSEDVPKPTDQQTAEDLSNDVAEFLLYKSEIRHKLTVEQVQKLIPKMVELIWDVLENKNETED
jgi:hypothetical protein